MAGGGGTNTISQSGPPEFLIPYLQAGLQGASQLYNQGPPAPFPISTIASPDPASLLGQSWLLNYAGTGAQDVARASAQAGNNLLLAMDPTTNPTLLNFINSTGGRAVDTFKENILPSIRDQQILAGGVGSGRGKSTEAQALGRTAREVADATASIMSNAYGQGLDAGVRGIGLAPTISQLGLQPGIIAQQVGDQRRAEEQALINATRERYNQYQNQSGQWLDDYIRRIQGQAGSAGNTTSQTMSGGSSPLTTGLGLATTGLGLAGTLGAFGSAAAPAGIAGLATAGVGPFAASAAPAAAGLAAIPGYGWAALAAMGLLGALGS